MASAGTSNQEAVVTYAPNERVLCYHGPLIYEAKIIKMQQFDVSNSQTGYTGWHYYVHYKGWKNTWDEWVQWDRLLKITQENVEKQKEVLAKYTPAQTASAGPRAMKSGGGGVGGPAAHSAYATASTRAGRKDTHGRGQKRAREEDDTKKPDLRLNVPETMKVVLTDDWEAVTKNSQVVDLPKTPNVVQLLEEFTNHVIETKPSHLREPPTIAPTIKAGLIAYFDKALGNSLLYRGERVQYSHVKKMTKTGRHVLIEHTKEVSEIYGAEHLLRMLVHLPSIVATTTLDSESVLIVRDYANELILWMDKNRARLFGNYVHTDSGYQNLTKT